MEVVCSTLPEPSDSSESSESESEPESSEPQSESEPESQPTPPAEIVCGHCRSPEPEPVSVVSDEIVNDPIPSVSVSVIVTEANPATLHSGIATDIPIATGLPAELPAYTPNKRPRCDAAVPVAPPGVWGYVSDAFAAVHRIFVAVRNRGPSEKKIL
jgi:hypothetical protein